MRKLYVAGLGFGALVLGAWLFITTGGAAPGLPPASAPFTSTTTAPDFTGTLLAASDADMRARAYVNGEVGKPEGVRDTLSVFPFGPAGTRSGTVFASNSVVGWPQIVEPSPDGRHVYVIEIRAEFPNDVTRYDSVYLDAPNGRTLSVFDIADPLSPRLVSQHNAGTNPSSVVVSADGSLLFTSSEEAGEEIVIFTLENGLPTERLVFPYPNAWPDAGTVRNGVRALAVHPSGNFLAAIIDDHQIAFLRVERDGRGRPSAISALGAPIDDFLDDPGTAIAAGEFSDNGRYFLVPDIGWGHQTPRDFLFSKRGRLISIAFDPGGDHSVADVAAVGWHPEGMTLSGDNRLVATVNMERTSVAGTVPAGLIARRRGFSSLSLLGFDDRTGELEKLDERRFRGILPEDAVFDADDDMLAVTIYEMSEFETEKGFIEFWDIDRSGAAPALRRTGLALPVTRGVHDLALIP